MIQEHVSGPSRLKGSAATYMVITLKLEEETDTGQNQYEGESLMLLFLNLALLSKSFILGKQQKNQRIKKHQHD